jgi:hypothetical protein
MDRVYSTHETREMAIKFWSQNLKVRDHLRTLDEGDKIILKCILRKQYLNNVHWIRMDHDRSQS